jgi:hypothetical protein
LRSNDASLHGMSDHADMDVLSTWTDGLNRALAPLDLLLSGEDAAAILPAMAKGRALAGLRTMTDEDCVRIAAEANANLGVERVTAGQIAEAIAYTLRHWSE